MKVSVWDTYVKRSDGRMMHFDIIVSNDLTEKQVVYGYGGKYLRQRQIQSAAITTNECKFCHIEQATEEMIRQIEENGYYILEMENCN
ncbi:MAG: DUF2024 family protein [Maribacter sp.]|uniref:DUF2024 family protein n=1 Tax=Maribacter sp. TaxID=1897614 RepID=UPI00329854C7